MKKSKFSDSQIMDALKRVEAGVPVPELCREIGISTAAFYKWRSKFGGMDASLMARMKELEEENRRLKKMYIEEKLKDEIAAEYLAKSNAALSPPLDGQRSGGPTWHQHPAGLPGCSRSARAATATKPSAMLKMPILPAGCYA
jgi:putative transposase